MSKEKAEVKVNEEKPKEPEQKSKAPLSLLSEFKYELLILEKSLTNKDVRQIVKILKGARKYKKHLKAHHFAKLWDSFYAPILPFSLSFKEFKDFNPEFNESLDLNKNTAQRLLKVPEIEIYLLTVLSIYLVQQRSLENARNILDSLVEKVGSINKRYFDNLNATVFFYFSRVYELLGNLNAIRPILQNAFRTACLHKDEIGQATLLNLLLRNLLHYNLYEAANHLITKTSFPEHKSNNEYVRYLFYTGKIKAVQLEYVEAFSRIMQAIRKSPENVALGFRIQAQKLATVVELLMGDIPSRATFSQTDLRKPLFPYYRVVQTVIKGDLDEFHNLVQTFSKIFIRDKLFTLIKRLHQNVIKTGLRRIDLSYSRISLSDVAKKLHLPEDQDIEFIVAKSIRDGVINATIDHESKTVVIKESKDFYSTDEPQNAFQKRIAFCLNLHTQANKALQYPFQKTLYKERDDKEDLSPEELLKMVEDEDDF